MLISLAMSEEPFPLYGCGEKKKVMSLRTLILKSRQSVAFLAQPNPKP